MQPVPPSIARDVLWLVCAALFFLSFLVSLLATLAYRAYPEARRAYNTALASVLASLFVSGLCVYRYWTGVPFERGFWILVIAWGAYLVVRLGPAARAYFRRGED